jgi:hypothetical protein
MVHRGFGKLPVRLAAAAAVAGGLALAGAGRSNASSFTGHWKVVLNARCANSPQNAKICNKVFGGLKGIGVTGTTLSEQFTVNVTVAANGHYTAPGSGTISESGSGAKVRGCPSATKYGTIVYSGTCPFSAFYKGHIADSKYGFPEFHGETYSITFNGRQLGTFKDDNSGMPSPARLGTYSAAWVAQIVGSKTVPAGFGFSEVVSR